MTSYYGSDAMIWDANFHTDFKVLIGFTVAIWKNQRPNFRVTKMIFYEEAELI